LKDCLPPQYAVALPSCGGRRWAATHREDLIPYITTKTTEQWSTIGNEGKSDLYMVAREGWKDR